MSALPPGYLDAAYLRVASLAVGAYELLCTIPAEYRFYRQQILRRSLSQQCALFILIRYLSVAVVVVSNVGFFGHFPSLEACRRFMLTSPVFKALQTLASQFILASRAYTISRKARWVFWTMIGTFLLTVPMEFLSNVHGRKPVHNPITHNCTSGNSSAYRIAWAHYLMAMIFDVVAICISTGYLWYYSSTASRISHFLHVLLYEGLGYFVVLTAVNVFNLFLYIEESEATQSTGASLGYVIIFIMSQRILIRQREYADKYAAQALPSNISNNRSISVSRRLDSTREINEALRSQFESGFSDSVGKYSSSAPRSWSQSLSPTMRFEDTQGRIDAEVDEMSDARSEEIKEELRGRARSGAVGTESGLDVQVRIERTVTVRRIPTAVAFGRETYRRPRVMWEQ